MVEGIIERWLKKPGDKISKYDPLVDVVTDKVTMEIPSPYEGTLTRILVEEGATVSMGTIIAEIETIEDPSDDLTAKPATSNLETRTIGTFADSEVNLEPARGVKSEKTCDLTHPVSRRRPYSPVVLKLALQHNVNLPQITGTGANGRVTKKDVLQFLEKMAAHPSDKLEAARTSKGIKKDLVPLSPIRRTIAHHMTQSSKEIPHAWTMVEIDITDIAQLREVLRSKLDAEERVDVTVFPFVVKVVAESLKDNPIVNSTWSNDKIIFKPQINIGIAVATHNGLVVPVIHKANSLSIADLNKRIRHLADRAHQGKLTLEDVQGGTFTLSNNGALGTVLSQPIINYPQAGILTTEIIQKRPIVINNTVVIRSMMNVCFSFDHRILDGLEAGIFLQTVKVKLEEIGPNTSIY